MADIATEQFTRNWSGVALIAAAIAFLTGVGLIMYGLYLPSTINPLWEPMGIGDLADPILRRAHTYTWVGAVTLTGSLFCVLLALVVRGGQHTPQR